MTKKEHKELKKFVDRIWPVYVILDWRWAAEQQPSKAELVTCLLELIDRLKGDEKLTSCETGGLYVDRFEGLLEYGMRITGSCFEE